MTAPDAPVHYDVTRIALIDALGNLPLGEHLHLEPRGRMADALLAQMPVASPPSAAPPDKIPADAITAAARAIAHYISGTEQEPFPRPDAEDILWATEALEAALPYLLVAAGKGITEKQAREAVWLAAEAPDTERP